MKSSHRTLAAIFMLASLGCLSGNAPAQRLSSKTAAGAAQTSAPTVTRIDNLGLKKLLKPKGKPLLINFWATWCDPCREEFPDLVKIGADYKGKIDVITISLDDLADIKTFVPKFLLEMKADMPAYLLRTKDENAAIALVSRDWAGNLPLTVLYQPDGKTAYLKKGKFKYEVLAVEIDKLVGAPASVPQQ
jgi:thiol-disulfide isomerase/thioredoxin